MEKAYTCVICGKASFGYGNNPWPVKDDGLCCDECNGRVVIPARIARFRTKPIKEETPRIAGILFSHGEGDHSFWQPDFTEEEHKEFMEFLKKYMNNGSSVRGLDEDMLKELLES